MQKGFTLMELLGVIVILSLLMIILVPNVLEQLNNKKEEVSKVQEETIKAAAELYVDDHPNKFNTSNPYCVCLSTLKNNGYLSDDFKSDITGNKFSDNYGVKVTIEENKDIVLRLGNCDSCK